RSDSDATGDAWVDGRGPRINLGTTPGVGGDPLASDMSYRAFLAHRSDAATVVAKFRSPIGGVRIGALVVSPVVTGLLWYLPGQLAHLDGQTSAALILLLPAFVSAYLARLGEHPFATRMLIGVRLCALGVGLCALAVTAIIGMWSLTEEPSLIEAMLSP